MNLSFNLELQLCRLAACIVLISASSGASAAFKAPVYGADDRLDLFEVLDPALLLLADSTVAFIDVERMDMNIATMTYSLKNQSLKDHRKVCSGEAFYDEPTLASCSGSLVGPDLVLTAGHCVKNLDECQNNMRVAFGFSLASKAGPLDVLPATEVYNCQEIVARTENFGELDFALIRLDRKVPNHVPLMLNRDFPIAIGTPLVVIGHPDGLPTKIDGGGHVRANTDPNVFISNLDTFKASSGSPVINRDTGLLEGFVSGGEQDYDFDFDQQCYRIRHCTDADCGGERSVRASLVAPFIPELKPTIAQSI